MASDVSDILIILSLSKKGDCNLYDQKSRFWSTKGKASGATTILNSLYSLIIIFFDLASIAAYGDCQI